MKMLEKNTPIQSILICDKCGSKDICYSNDDNTILSNYISISEWASGKIEDCEDFDYSETVQCNNCKYTKTRRRKKR